MDDIRVYNRELTDTEVSSLYSYRGVAIPVIYTASYGNITATSFSIDISGVYANIAVTGNTTFSITSPTTSSVVSGLNSNTLYSYSLTPYNSDAVAGSVRLLGNVTTLPLPVPVVPTVLNSQFNSNTITSGQPLNITTTTTMNNWTCNTTTNSVDLSGGTLALRNQVVSGSADATYGYPYSGMPSANIYTLGIQHYYNVFLATFTRSVNFTTIGTFRVSIWALPRSQYYNVAHRVGITIDGTAVISDVAVGTSGATNGSGSTSPAWKFLTGTYNCTTTGNKNIVIRSNCTSAFDTTVQLAYFSIIDPSAVVVQNSYFDANPTSTRIQINTLTTVSNWTSNYVQQGDNLLIFGDQYYITQALADPVYGTPFGGAANAAIYHIQVQQSGIRTNTFTQTVNFLRTGTFTVSIWAIPRPTWYNTVQTIGITIGGTTVIGNTSVGPSGTTDASGPLINTWKYLSGTYIATTTGNKNIVILINNPSTFDTTLMFSKFSLVQTSMYT
jgi:hypothetical protein